MCLNNFGGNSSNRTLVKISCYQVNMYRKSTIFSSAITHLILTNQCSELLSKTKTSPLKLLCKFQVTVSVTAQITHRLPRYTIRCLILPFSPPLDKFCTTNKDSSREKKTLIFHQDVSTSVFTAEDFPKGLAFSMTEKKRLQF